MKRILFLIAVITFLSINIFSQAIPKQISYQGVLKDASGNVLTGDFVMTFKIYNDPSGGSALWTEIQTVSVASGLFSVQLGSINPITTVPFDREHYLGITIGIESELTPRTLLNPSPYSFMSMNVLDNVITTSKIQDGAVTSLKIGNNEVVKSLNGLKDNVNLVAGDNITLTPSGNDLTISATTGGGGTIGGSGTTNYIPLFTGTTAIGNSLIYQTDGGNIGIGTITPSAKLELSESDALVNGLTIGRGTANLSYNSAFGYRALYSITTGNYNTANGYQALYSNTEGDDNTANGYWALYSNGTGRSNTANGYLALRSNTTGSYNSAIGGWTLRLNTTGSYNTASGFQALNLNTEGERNTASGVYALSYNTTGSYNTANGDEALSSNTTGSYNTANGVAALDENTTESYNTAVGYEAGDYYPFSTGTFLGAVAYPNSSGYSNIMGLGYNARPTASNQVRIGNSSVTSIGGYAGWTNFSDGRYKTSIQENVKGLDFIIKLHPITYQLDMNKLSANLKENQRRDENGNITIESSETDIKSRIEKSQIVHTGFVAQEVEKAAKDLGYDFSGVDAPKNANDFYGLRYAEFVVPLVKAVQEQQKLIEELTRRIEELEKK